MPLTLKLAGARGGSDRDTRTLSHGTLRSAVPPAMTGAG